MKGIANLPKPQGPFVLKLSKPTIELTFRNPFANIYNFSIKWEPMDLIDVSTKTGVENIKPKTDKVFTVLLTDKALEILNQSEMLHHPITGKITISPMGPNTANVVWSYYIQSEN